MSLIIDIETTGLDFRAPSAAILMLGVIDSEGHTRIHHLASKHKNWRDRLDRIGESLCSVGGHNIKFDLLWLKHFGLNLEPEFDTMLEAHLINSERKLRLKDLMSKHMGGDWTYDGPWDDSDPDGVAEYLEKDLIATHKLHEINRNLMTKAQLGLHDKVLIPVMRELIEAEYNGVNVDAAKLNGAEKEVNSELERVNDELAGYVPSDIPSGLAVKWGSTKFQRWLMFDHYGIKPVERGKPTKDWPDGAPSMSAYSLANIEHPIANLLRHKSELQKIKDGFITPYLNQMNNGRLYTSFRMAGTRTGRLSSGAIQSKKGKTPAVGINLQQVPRNKLVRGLFSAPPGYKFIEADYSQLELRVAAVVSGDKSMLDIYRTGGDIHHETAVALGGGTPVERVIAKVTNFGFLYGMSAKSFVSFAKMSYGADISLSDAKAFREAYFKRFSGLRPWHRRAKARAHKLGYVQTLFGRRRYLPDLRSEDESRVALAERQAVNTSVQGTGSDILLVALARLSQVRGDGWQLQGLVHDSMLWVVPEHEAESAAELIRECMERPIKGIDIPLVADVAIGEKWGDK